MDGWVIIITTHELPVITGLIYHSFSTCSKNFDSHGTIFVCRDAHTAHSIGVCICMVVMMGGHAGSHCCNLTLNYHTLWGSLVCLVVYISHLQSGVSATARSRMAIKTQSWAHFSGSPCLPGYPE
ncbi:unnamed protein product [Ectocarpus sp. 8 AP-2014]